MIIFTHWSIHSQHAVGQGRLIIHDSMKCKMIRCRSFSLFLIGYVILFEVKLLFIKRVEIQGYNIISAIFGIVLHVKTID